MKYLCRRLGDFEKEIQLANTYIHETPFCPIFLGSVFNSNIVIWFLDQIFLQSDFIVHSKVTPMHYIIHIKQKEVSISKLLIYVMEKKTLVNMHKKACILLIDHIYTYNQIRKFSPLHI